MSKLSFRARALDASKPMPIFMAEELPDLPDYSAINRAVPQMPSGMQKEEECEHHLQRAICTGLIIPTPEVTSLTDAQSYDKIYPADYKLPRQLIHMQPFAMEQDVPDYDMDSEDEKWVDAQSCKMGLTPIQFEEMMDRLEKSSGQTVVTLNEAKALLKEDDDLIIAVFDYWLNKRLKTQHPLLLTVKTENRLGTTANNPYLAFRRRTEKMQTRKNRKNDETSYEKMLKLRRDLSRAVTLLEMVKKREKIKREILHLTVEVYEKRYQAQDFSGSILAELSSLKPLRPAFAPIFTNQFGVHQNWSNKTCGKDENVLRKEKRQYKRRKHKMEIRTKESEDKNILTDLGSCANQGNRLVSELGLNSLLSSDEDSQLSPQLRVLSDCDDDSIDEGLFVFRRNKHNSYLPPVSDGFGNWPWCNKNEGGLAEEKYRFSFTSLRKPIPRCIGLVRRRMGRGGRVILDRYSTENDDVWSSLDFTIHESNQKNSRNLGMTDTNSAVNHEWLHFHPRTPPTSQANQSVEDCSSSEINVSSACGFESLTCSFPSEITKIRIDIESDRLNHESSVTSEFNVSDYFPINSLTDLDFTLNPSNNMNLLQNSDWETDELGCSHFLVLPEVEDFFLPQVRHQSSLEEYIKMANSSNLLSYVNNQPNSPGSATVSTPYRNLNSKSLKHRQEITNDDSICIVSNTLSNPVSMRKKGSKEIKQFDVKENFHGCTKEETVK